MNRRNFLKTLWILTIAPTYAMAERVITTKDGISLTVQDTISTKSTDKKPDELWKFIEEKVNPQNEDSLWKLIEEKWILKQDNPKVKEPNKEKENITNIQKYDKSKNNIWVIELDFFSDFFWIKTEDEFVKKVTELQKEFWAKTEHSDWIIWASTLKWIYIKHYSKNIDKLPLEIKKRLEIYTDMKWYSLVKSALSWKLDAFNNKIFYWDSIWINVKWTYINENLNWKVPQTIQEKINKIEFINIWWKSILLFYVKGNLEVATYVSPWLYTWEKRTPKLKTTWKLQPHKLHISSEYPKIKDDKWLVIKKWWAVMPYATHIDWSIWIHWTDWKLDWNPASSWCIRTWLYYIEHIHNLVKRLWIQNVQIDTNKIY